MKTAGISGVWIAGEGFERLGFSSGAGADAHSQAHDIRSSGAGVAPVSELNFPALWRRLAQLTSSAEATREMDEMKRRIKEGLDALLLSPRESSRVDALMSTASSPDIVLFLQRKRAELVEMRDRKPASQCQTKDGHPVPRKRDLTANGELVGDACYNQIVTPVDSREIDKQFAQYAEASCELALAYANQGRLLDAYICFVEGMAFDAEFWTRNQGRYEDSLLKAAAFMVLSAKQASAVADLYDLYPLDQGALSREVSGRLERLIRAYESANRQLFDGISIETQLRNILSLLKEEDTIRVISEGRQRQLLTVVGAVARARQFSSIELSVATLLGDTKVLNRLAGAISEVIYHPKGSHYSTATLNYRLPDGVDAYIEAGNYEALKSLLIRCRRAKIELEAMAEGDRDPRSLPVLKTVISSLESVLERAEDITIFDLTPKAGSEKRATSGK